MNQKFITQYHHKKWFAGIFKRRTKNPVLICVKDYKVRVGVIRFTRLSNGKNGWEIHFTVSPRYRGRGFAQPILKSALGWFHHTRPNQVVYAQVKALNFKSLKVLRFLGFKREITSKISSGLLRLRLLSRKKTDLFALKKTSSKKLS